MCGGGCSSVHVLLHSALCTALATSQVTIGRERGCCAAAAIGRERPWPPRLGPSVGQSVDVPSATGIGLGPKVKMVKCETVFREGSATPATTYPTTLPYDACGFGTICWQVCTASE